MYHPKIVPLIMVCNDEYWLPYVLKSAEPHFDRFVIYDIGSTDKTSDIIDWFLEKNRGSKDIYFRRFPMLDPRVQGALRNSMIAEARSDYYLVLDADEIYSPESYELIRNIPMILDKAREHNPNLIYGIVPRIEITDPLDLAYGTDLSVPHHRIYHRTAIWKGTHPGEEPYYKQKDTRERWFRNAPCFHFHNTARSSKDEEAPSRVRRRGKKTYHPGNTQPIELLKLLPILERKIEDFPVNPSLEALQ